MKPHILFILDYYKPFLGGSETVFENIITRLLKKGYRISMLTCRFKKSLLEVEKDGNLTIHRHGKNRIFFMRYAFWHGLKLLKANPDIEFIHTSTYGGAIPSALLRFFCKKKVILTVHEIFGKLRYRYKGKIKGRLYHFFEKHIFFFNYDMYHCVSNYTMNSLRVCYGVHDNKIRMIHNGVDNEFWDVNHVSVDEIIDWKKEHNRNGRYVLLYYGHSGFSKGIDYLVKAIPGLVKAIPNILIVFNLISSRRDTNIKLKIKNYELKIEGKEYKEYVKVFDGFDVKDLRVLIASCDCVIAPSISEGFGSVHTESCAMSKNLITTNIASLPEVVWGKVKFIAPQSVEEIIQGVTDSKNGDFELILQRSFSWERTIDGIEKMYKTVKELSS